MAAAFKETELAQNVYAALQAVSCPLMEGLYLQDSESMLQLLCSPSQLRTEIFCWIFSSISPNFATLKEKRLQDPDALIKEMATLGHQLMLCKEDSQGLIRGEARPEQQLHFLQQLLTVVPGSSSAEHCTNVDALLTRLFSTNNLPQIAKLLTPTLDPWPANMKVLQKGAQSSGTQSAGSTKDLSALLQATHSVLQQLQSECEFLTKPETNSGTFTPSVLRVAACDLQQLTTAFCHVYETDLRDCCSREPHSLSADCHVFQRVHNLLLACNTELEMLSELSQASVCISGDLKELQVQPRYWSQGQKHTLSDQLEELSRRYRDFVSRLHS